MQRFWIAVAALGVGFLFFGGIVTSEIGFAVYLKKQASLNYIVTEIGTVTNIERLLLTFNQRYSLMLVGYSETRGLRFFETMPELP
jgi:hypothetical protein